MTTAYDHPRTEMVDFLPRSAASVLDVGCSSGAFGRELRAHQHLAHLIGIEPTEEAARRAAEVYDEIVTDSFPSAQDQLPPGLTYDVVFFNDVLEHMMNPEEALAAAKKLLNPGGVIVASIPNIRHISVIGPLVIRGEFRYRASGILDATHVRFFTRRTIERLFIENGWRITRIESLNRVLRVGQTESPWWIKALSKLSAGHADGLFSVQYVVVAEPEPV